MSGIDTNLRATLSPLGVMMLDTAFPRPVGDIGHADTWPFPMLYEVVPRAHVRTVVGQSCPPDVLDRFVMAGERLVARGARGLLTSCGFLALAQAELARRLPVPVASSALLLVPLVQRLIAPRRVGVLTYDARALTPAHFESVGADPVTPFAGLDQASAFHAMVERGGPYLAREFAREITVAATTLVARNPDLGAIVLECTNFPPFAAAIKAATNRPVFDVVGLGRLMQSGLACSPCANDTDRDQSLSWSHA